MSDPNLAIETLKESSARLVILDIDMPGKSGLSLLEEIKEIDGSIQVFMLTGMVSMGTILRATQLGAEECQFKPISDFDALGNAADRSYEKMLRWWRTLREWKERNSQSTKSPASPTIIDLQPNKQDLVLEMTTVSDMSAPKVNCH